MNIWTKLAIIFGIGSVITLVGLITGICWPLIYQGLLYAVSIRITSQVYNYYIHFIFIAIIINTIIYKLCALESNTHSYVFKNIFIHFD